MKFRMTFLFKLIQNCNLSLEQSIISSQVCLSDSEGKISFPYSLAIRVGDTEVQLSKEERVSQGNLLLTNYWRYQRILH